MIKDILPELDLGGAIPETVEITVRVNNIDDTVTVTQCMNPEFDVWLLTEGLASLILVAAKYTEKSPKMVLEDVHSKLLNAVKHHASIKKS